MKTRLLIIIGIIVVIATSLSSFAIYESSTVVFIDCDPRYEQIDGKCVKKDDGMGKEPEPEDVLGIAQEFIKSSPTFLFDGIPDTLSLELVAIRESFPEQYVIEGDFDSL
ncbi:MAG: hypothetical protein QQN41_12565, partial [Nitrosopumilus sp.]